MCSRRPPFVGRHDLLAPDASQHRPWRFSPKSRSWITHFAIIGAGGASRCLRSPSRQLREFYWGCRSWGFRYRYRCCLRISQCPLRRLLPALAQRVAPLIAGQTAPGRQNAMPARATSTVNPAYKRHGKILRNGKELINRHADREPFRDDHAARQSFGVLAAALALWRAHHELPRRQREVSMLKAGIIGYLIGAGTVAAIV